jgi:hypothetical protein
MSMNDASSVNSVGVQSPATMVVEKAGTCRNPTSEIPNDQLQHSD